MIKLFNRSQKVSANVEKRRRWPWLVGAAALLAVGGGAGAWAVHYSDHALPGTSVAGQDVSGMTQSEIAKLVSSKASSAKVSISGAVNRQASLSELGVKVDAAATAKAALSPNASIMNRFTAPFTSNNSVSVVSTSSSIKIDEYIAKILPPGSNAPVNASVTFNEEETTFEVVSGKDGQSLSPKEIEQAATSAATNLSSTSVKVAYVNTAPTITYTKAKAAADKANTIVKNDVTITDPDGDTYTADTETKAAWIKVGPSTDGKNLAVTVDKEAVTKWVNKQASAAQVTLVEGERNVYSDGKVATVVVEAKDGKDVQNASTVSEQLLTSLNSGKVYAGKFEYKTTKAEWKERTIANGAEKLVYPAAEGEKWIDVNLSNATVTAYEGATVVHGPVGMVPGAPGTETVTGTYHVYLKYAAQDMGCTAGWDYCSKDVPWVTYFTGSYALHGAPWRNSFGWSGEGGSHGCVNMPVSEAKWVYDWAPVGTTVVSHY